MRYLMIIFPIFLLLAASFFVRYFNTPKHAISLVELWKEAEINDPKSIEYISALTTNAERGDGSAQLALAELYKWGKLVKKDEQKSDEWYEKAAESGQVRAQKFLCMRYGNILPRGAKLSGPALKWCQMGADYGDLNCLLAIANMHQKKSNINYKEANFYSNLALKYASSTKENRKFIINAASRIANETSAQLNESELNDIHERVKAWQPKVSPPQDNEVILVAIPEAPETPPTPKILINHCRDALTDEQYNLRTGNNTNSDTHINAKGKLCRTSKGCEAKSMCGNTVIIDCGHAMDGSLYFADIKTGEILSTCSFWGGCKVPRAWTCNDGTRSINRPPSSFK